MPLFSSATPYDGEIEKATNEMNTADDWALIMDICDKVQRTPNTAKDCLKSIVKRLNHKVPHVAMQALTLMDACVNNAGKPFHLEVASRDFVSECRTLIGGKAHPKVALKLKLLIKKWSEEEFKSDPSLNLIPSLYASLKSEGQSFVSEEPAKAPQPVSKDPNVVSSQQEEDDIAKAIALSLKETDKGGKGKSSKVASSTLYPTFNANSSSTRAAAEARKVRALYDFEAAEDNEITFKAGEILSILDDSDPNWWKGSSWRGEGLFPANFVTADLTAEPEPENVSKEKKTVQFSEDVEVKTMEPLPEVMEIDEARIDETLNLLQNADPTGETNPDTPEMSAYEEQCKAMGPLIDQELEKIDRKHNKLMELNGKVVEALQMYHSLMRELPGYGYSSGLKMGDPQAAMMPPQMFNGQPQFAGLPPGSAPPNQVHMPQGSVAMAMPPHSTAQQTLTSVAGFPVENGMGHQYSLPPNQHPVVTSYPGIPLQGAPQPHDSLQQQQQQQQQQQPPPPPSYHNVVPANPGQPIYSMAAPQMAPPQQALL